ncbi:(Fe-S)-binding protein [Flammeovirga pacifica]|uniref:Ion-translocating oxidoreductase complex subunit B n=1 Tax=Flammeovirga pacifica TaxID=915059 RepID=A0A1S1YTK2_FLAPC|nr:RnfABCDGE type electron transport complex subunit B [Flammeovirga pacifica]OHX64361.1 Fe-S cluster protein [Flammeovirga pacifica]
MSIITALAALGGLTLLLAIMLIVANKKLYVFEDPRIDVVDDLLPKANCGACGMPGCRTFAEAVVKGEVLPGKCTVNSEEGKNAIADYLGVALGDEDKIVARLACQGGSNVAVDRAEYQGLSSCSAASLISGGQKGCFWGCLGLGDCSVSCDFDAIQMNKHGIPEVDVEKCTACGDCVESCPKGLFSLEPIENRLWVACKNLQKGDEILEECQVGCTACGKCVMDAEGGINMIDNLPRINYKEKLTQKPIQRCPTGAIVWLDDDKGIIKGKESKKIIRKEKQKVAFS